MNCDMPSLAEKTVTRAKYQRKEATPFLQSLLTLLEVLQMVSGRI